MAANLTAVWRVRISGSNTNGGGYDPGITGAGTDYSQQNAAQVSQSSTANTSLTATTTLQDTGASFTSALIGNAIWISGTGFTTYFTFITAVPSSTTLTLQTAASATGTAVSYNIGGGWADFWTNTTSALGYVVNGNTVYILGSGTPNPSSYSFDYTVPSGFQPPGGQNVGTQVYFANDPLTPGYKLYPDTTGGMPLIKATGTIITQQDNVTWSGCWFVAVSTSIMFSGGNNSLGNFRGCVFDQNGNDVNLINQGLSSAFLGCELFSSVTAAVGSSYIMIFGAYNGILYNCNVHDAIGNGIQATVGLNIWDNIIAKCNGTSYAIQVTSGSNGTNGALLTVKNCTIDGNGGNGLYIGLNVLPNGVVLNNIFSNNTGAGKSALILSSGTGASNASYTNLMDFNVFYNNTTNYTSVNAQPHDTALAVTPYVGSGTENYQLA